VRLTPGEERVEVTIKPETAEHVGKG